MLLRPCHWVLSSSSCHTTCTLHSVACTHTCVPRASFCLCFCGSAFYVTCFVTYMLIGCLRNTCQTAFSHFCFQTGLQQTGQGRAAVSPRAPAMLVWEWLACLGLDWFSPSPSPLSFSLHTLCLFAFSPLLSSLPSVGTTFLLFLFPLLSPLSLPLNFSPAAFFLSHLHLPTHTQLPLLFLAPGYDMIGTGTWREWAFSLSPFCMHPPPSLSHFFLFLHTYHPHLHALTVEII